jgi:hypothetical protein
MKQPKTTTATEQPTALDTLVGIVDLAVPCRWPDRTPTLGDLARLTGTASRCLRFDNVDERISTENAAVLAVAKKLALIS